VGPISCHTTYFSADKPIIVGYSFLLAGKWRVTVTICQSRTVNKKKDFCSNLWQ